MQFYNSKSNVLGTKRNIEESNINSCENDGKYFTLNKYYYNDFLNYISNKSFIFF